MIVVHRLFFSVCWLFPDCLLFRHMEHQHGGEDTEDEETTRCLQPFSLLNRAIFAAIEIEIIFRISLGFGSADCSVTLLA